ncbi:hypothetical protein ABPG77_001287 [Micractinium sp. CCAP 211/92]
MPKSWELDDETVLRLSGIACAGYATLMLAAPRRCHDIYYELQAGALASDEHVATARWVGQSMTGNALTALAVGLSTNSKDAKKNMLKAGGTTWAFASAMHLINVNSGVQKKDVGLSSAAFAALMSGLCLWRGFAKDDEGKAT